MQLVYFDAILRWFMSDLMLQMQLAVLYTGHILPLFPKLCNLSTTAYMHNTALCCVNWLLAAMQACWEPAAFRAVRERTDTI